MNKKRFFELLNDYETWKNMMLFSLFADLFFTITGVGRWGLVVEGNPVYRFIINYELYLLPVIMSLLLVFVLFPIAQSLWIKKRSYRVWFWGYFVFFSVITWINWFFILSSTDLVIVW